MALLCPYSFKAESWVSRRAFFFFRQGMFIPPQTQRLQLWSGRWTRNLEVTGSNLDFDHGIVPLEKTLCIDAPSLPKWHKRGTSLEFGVNPALPVSSRHRYGV